ncbi:MAG: hypothetical protein QF903_11065 [Planctomycetota bacterium]|nr:hypothetical protein [Planctomycetota bacterium]MDP6763754.1 hypothetical protein [Planctomycetota bacterium]MDP6990009.1 hypothetical protein [Planctomycetota bacterium]
MIRFVALAIGALLAPLAGAGELRLRVLDHEGAPLGPGALVDAALTVHSTVLGPARRRVVLIGEARRLASDGVTSLALAPGVHAVAVTLRGRPAGLFAPGVEVLESLVEIPESSDPVELVLRSRSPDTERGRLRVNARAAGRLLDSCGLHLASPLTGTPFDPRPAAGRAVGDPPPSPCFEWLDLPAGAYVLSAVPPPAGLGGIDWPSLAAPRLRVEVASRVDRVATLAFVPGGELALSLTAAPGEEEIGLCASLAREDEGIARPLFGALTSGEVVLSPRLVPGDYRLFLKRGHGAVEQLGVRIAGGSTVVLTHRLGTKEETMTEQPEGSGREALALHARRLETGGDGEVTAREETLRWDPGRTALVICDMWDDHWCASAARRVSELAPAVNELAAAARARGVTVLHAPSSVVSFYDGTPQRERARAAPFAPPPRPLSTDERWGTSWCWPDPLREPAMPVDDANMGCDCEPRCEIRDAWTRQVDTIEIGTDDYVTDDGQETFNVLAAEGIDHVAIAGVHLNMCVLGRPFGIRQLVHMGKEVVLVRDLTDTMYDPRMAPFVSHFEGTDLVVAHVERYWCPSIESSDVTGRPAFRFRR